MSPRAVGEHTRVRVTETHVVIERYVPIHLVPCATCGTLMRVSHAHAPGIRRIDAKFCSDACKSRDYRERVLR